MMEQPEATNAQTKQPLIKKQKAAIVLTVILTSIFAVEGGYVNNPADPGGETNMGITKAVAQQNGYRGSMRTLPKELAASIYFKDYIQAPGFEPFLDLAPAVAEELVDSGVNAGTARPRRWLQASLNSLNRGGRDYPDLPVDGKIGPSTINAYKALQHARGEVEACKLTVKLLDAQQAVYYMSLSNLETFTPGWVHARIGNVNLNDCQAYAHGKAA